jgi:hypothetical protein
MSTYRFTLGDQPQVDLAGCQGRVEIEVWAEHEASVETEASEPQISQEGNALLIRSVRGDMRLRLPAGTAVTLADQQGDVSIQGSGAVNLTGVSGDVRLHTIEGPITVQGAGALRLSYERNRRPQRHLSYDVQVRDVRSFEFDNVPGNLTTHTCGQVAGENVGGNCTIGEVGGELRLRNIGGNADINAVAGSLELRNIGGNAELREVGAVRRIGNVGGNLTLVNAVLAAEAPPERFAVGGNARIELPDQANLTIGALVGGSVKIPATGRSAGPGMITVVYGNGAAQLRLIAGGNVELHGGGTPQVSGKPWNHMGAEIGREMGRIGAELGRAGAEIGRAVAEAFSAGSDDRDRERSWQQVAERVRGAEDQPVTDDTREERLIILRMIAEKRISAEDGAALLDALRR